MLATLSLVLSALALALAAGLALRLRRAGRERAALARALHDKALALDRRCDALQRQLDAVEMARRIDHLRLLVAAGERDGRLGGEVAARLRRYALALRDEHARGEAS